MDKRYVPTVINSFVIPKVVRIEQLFELEWSHPRPRGFGTPHAICVYTPAAWTEDGWTVIHTTPMKTAFIAECEFRKKVQDLAAIIITDGGISVSRVYEMIREAEL